MFLIVEAYMYFNFHEHHTICTNVPSNELHGRGKKPYTCAHMDDRLHQKYTDNETCLIYVYLKQSHSHITQDSPFSLWIEPSCTFAFNQGFKLVDFKTSFGDGT